MARLYASLARHAPDAPLLLITFLIHRMKFGDSALGGSAGLRKHLKDFADFVNDEKRYKTLVNTMSSQFDQMRELGLIRFGANGNEYIAIPDENARPEVIFLIANHNPDSSILSTLLDELRDDDDYVKSLPFDLRFFVANFAGYGLHEKSMLTLAEFCAHINFVDSRKVQQV